MKRFLKFILISITPVIIVASLVILFAKDIEYTTSKADPTRCTLKCYYDTHYCKVHHVKHINFFELSDKIYFGIIDALKSTGNYEKANVYVLVVGVPLLIYILFVYSVAIQFIINRKHA